LRNTTNLNGYGWAVAGRSHDMPDPEITIERDAPASIVAYLEDRLYEFNVQATAIADGMGLTALLRDENNEIVAGINGHTWGASCEIKQLWVAASQRRRGLGRRLLEAAEAEAIRRGCVQMLLSTHSFQAPGFYEKLGFERIASIPNYPRGHEQIFFKKVL
jgi:ribosomal protein S18 acetylase RimI-like enzyme